ncbi:hypothetical protein V5799_009851, partial [Amblyomma americanum]
VFRATERGGSSLSFFKAPLASQVGGSNKTFILGSQTLYSMPFDRCEKLLPPVAV